VDAEVVDAIKGNRDGARMIQSKEETHSKKPYSPPQLMAISLRPEEAVLGACKTLNSGGHSGSGGCVFSFQCPASNAGS
jgi:hypothetical protein